MAPAGASPVRWISPFDAAERARLRAWCEPVGPVARHDPFAPSERWADLTIVSWNMAVGAGSLVELVRTLRTTGSGDASHFVLLIQEAYRASDEVPAACPSGSGAASRIAPNPRPDGADIMQLAERLALHAVYVPSMRNGKDCAEWPREDRGNAILSTLPLADVAAIELPFAQQRRVGVAAVVSQGTQRLRVASIHFDTFFGHRRQAQGLVQALAVHGPVESTVVGGDFNAHPLDAGIREMRRHFTAWPCGEGATHTSGRRLDHLFVSGVTDGMPCETGRERFGSDHSPLIARLTGLLPS